MKFRQVFDRDSWILLPIAIIASVVARKVYRTSMSGIGFGSMPETAPMTGFLAFAVTLILMIIVSEAMPHKLRMKLMSLLALVFVGLTLFGSY